MSTTRATISSGKHREQHSSSGPTVRDVVIGMSDGLTVPFALAAGVSGAVASTGIVVSAGVAELAAGAISMGLGGYLAAGSDADYYASEYRREEMETETMPDEERAEVATILSGYGLRGQALGDVVGAIAKDRTTWVEFMMRYELGLEKPDEARAPRSALTIGGSYVAGGIVPLLPYAIVHDAHVALGISCVLTAIALFFFGAWKARVTGAAVVKNAIQSVIVGGIAAGVAFALARAVSPR